jgi:inner membrane transporter RhtA
VSAAEAARSRRGRDLAVMMALGSMSSIQLGAALSKPLFHRIGPAGTVWLRLVFAGIILVAFARPRIRARSRQDIGLAVTLGAVSGLMTLAFFEAIARIPLGITVAIEFLGPLSVALAGSRRALDGVWLVLAGTGIALLTLGHPVSGSLSGLGVGFALLAAIGWGTYILLTQAVGRRWPGMEGLAVSLSVSAIVTAPFGLAGGPSRFADGGLLISALGLALLLPLAPYALELAALRRLAARSFGVLMSLEPAIGALFGFVILGQGLAGAGILAIALVMLASLGATLTTEPVQAFPRHGD